MFMHSGRSNRITTVIYYRLPVRRRSNVSVDAVPSIDLHHKIQNLDRPINYDDRLMAYPPGIGIVVQDLVWVWKL